MADSWQELLRRKSIASLDALAERFGRKHVRDLERLRQAADNFEFKGTAGNCSVTDITWVVSHFGHAGGGCSGNPNCDDNPDDYTAINVVIYNDAFAEGGPPDVLTVDCNSVALPDGPTGGAPFACTPVAGEAAACGAAATTQCCERCEASPIRT